MGTHSQLKVIVTVSLTLAACCSAMEGAYWLQDDIVDHRRRLADYSNTRRRLDAMQILLNHLPCKTRRRKSNFNAILCAAVAGTYFVVDNISSYYKQKLKNEEPLTQTENLLMQEISKTQAQCYEMAKLLKDDAPLFLELVKDCNAAGTEKFRALKGTTPTDMAGQQKSHDELKAKIQKINAALKETKETEAQENNVKGPAAQKGTKEAEAQENNVNPAPEGQQQPGARRE